MPAGLKQRRSSKDKNYYANQFGKTTANKVRRATKAKHKRARSVATNSRPLRKTSKTRQIRRRKLNVIITPAQGAKAVNDNATSAQAALVS